MTDPKRGIHGVRSPLARLKRIAEIIDLVEQRCLIVDGPVANTRHEMTDQELRMIYEIALGYRIRRSTRG